MNINLTMFAQVLLFVLFIIGAKKWAWPIMLARIEERQKLIADGLAEAERGRSSLATAQKESEALLRDARGRAQEIVAAAEKLAGQRVEEAKTNAKSESDRMIAQAHAQVQQEVQSAKQALREQVAALAVSGAEKILAREVDARSHADMLNRLKAQL